MRVRAFMRVSGGRVHVMLSVCGVFLAYGRVCISSSCVLVFRVSSCACACVGADVVRGLLQKTPTKRMSGIQVLYSDWLKGDTVAVSAPPARPVLARQSSSTMDVDAFTHLPLAPK